MGYLLGAFGKLMAGKRLRDLQARMTSVQSQLRRATRDIANMEKTINAQARQMKNSMRMFSTMQMSGMQNGLNAYLAGLQNSIFGDFTATYGNDASKWSAEVQKLYASKTSEYQMQAQLANNSMGSMQQMLQTSMMQQQQQVENYVEMMKEAQLEPLKDLEDDLMAEKDTLETQIQLAEADYKGNQEQEKAGAQNLVPRYTGQG